MDGDILGRRLAERQVEGNLASGLTGRSGCAYGNRRQRCGDCASLRVSYGQHRLDGTLRCIERPRVSVRRVEYPAQIGRILLGGSRSCRIPGDEAVRHVEDTTALRDRTYRDAGQSCFNAIGLNTVTQAAKGRRAVPADQHAIEGAARGGCGRDMDLERG